MKGGFALILRRAYGAVSRDCLKFICARFRLAGYRVVCRANSVRATAGVRLSSM